MSISKYEENIRHSSCRTINDIIEWCHETLPSEWKAYPWRHPELNHGIDLLASDEALNCYMSAYGEMHSNKCKAAMMSFPFERLKGSIEIVDWGCGQGIGSATVIDVLQQHNLLIWVKRITLIEPSAQALMRAEANVSKIVGNNIEIDAINKFMPAEQSDENTISSIGYRYSNVIHIFSNILDVKAIDLAAVARMVASSHGNHFILCLGPKNGAAYRIEQFCSVFGEQEYFSKIDSVRYGHTTRTGHPYTCFTRCFTYNGSPLDYSRLSLFNDFGQGNYNDYDLRLQIQNNVFSPQKGRVAFRLQNILSVDDIMYIDPVVNEVVVDFIIVRPNKGVLLVNLFEQNLNDSSLSEDGKEITLETPQHDSDKITYQSPIDLISLCQTSIKDGIEELLMSTIKSSKNFGLIKKVVIFTENSTEEVKSFFNVQKEQINYVYLYGSEFINDKDVSKKLYEKIGLLQNSPSFDDAVKRKLASIISPSWHSYQEGKAGFEPKGAQKKLVVSQNIHQKISGVAGSGKTHVLAARAVNALKRTGGNVLILTYNITLANYLKYRLSELREDFSWEKIDIYPYHQFFRIRASECKLHVDFDAYDRLSFFDNTPIHKRYSAIFVDEVQDYTTEWLRIVMHNFLLPNGEFVVFGDPKQNIYHRPIDSNGDIRLGVIRSEWNRQLSTGQRFTNPRLASLATAFQSTFLTDLPVDSIQVPIGQDNSLNFQVVTYFNLRNDFNMDILVSKLVDIINSSGYETKDFVVLASSSKMLQNIDIKYRQQTGEKTEVTFVTKEQCEELKQIHNVSDEHPASWKYKRDYEAIGRSRKQLFTTDKRCLKLSTIKSFKGWESPAVIVILDDDYNPKATCNIPMEPATMYTAITRARESLYIINIGNETYDKFFKEQII